MFRLPEKKNTEREKGQALPEFALVLPIILLILVGIVEIGYGLNSYLTVVDAARDGARLGAKGDATDAQITNLVIRETERLPDGVTASDVTVSRIGATAVSVKVCYDHSLIMGVSAIIPDPLRICSETSMPSVVE